MPALVGKYRDQVLITQSKKTFSTISNAFNSLKAESGYSDYSVIFENSSEQVLNDLTKYIQVTQNCGTKNGCWAKGTKPQKNSSGPAGHPGRSRPRTMPRALPPPASPSQVLHPAVFPSRFFPSFWLHFSTFRIIMSCL